MALVDRVQNELLEIDDDAVADILMALLDEIGSRGRSCGEACISAIRSQTNVNVEEALAQLEPLFEE